MEYTLGDKVLRIPDAEIAHHMEKLKCTKEEAIQLYLEDEGILDNDEVEEMTKKAKVNRVSKGTGSKHSSSTKTREKKISEEKKEIFNNIYKNLSDIYGECTKISIENKMITVEINGILFKVDIIQTRNK